MIQFCVQAVGHSFKIILCVRGACFMLFKEATLGSVCISLMERAVQGGGETESGDGKEAPRFEPTQRTQIPDLKPNASLLRSKFHLLLASSLLLFTERVEVLRGSEKNLSHTKSLSQGHGEEVSVKQSETYGFFP